MSSEFNPPKFCCWGYKCNEPAVIYIAEVEDANNRTQIGPFSLFATRDKHNNFTNCLAVGYRFVKWHNYCAQHFMILADAAKTRQLEREAEKA